MDLSPLVVYSANLKDDIGISHGFFIPYGILVYLLIVTCHTSGVARLTFGSFGLFLHGYLLLLHANKQWYEQSRAQGTRPVAEGIER